MRMPKTVLTVVVFIVAMSGCTPLVVGAGAAVVADKVVEQEKGGDGLF